MKARSLRLILSGLAGCLLIFPAPKAHADLVQLNNGDRISGILQRLGQSECILSTDFQPELRIPLRRIVVLQTDHTVSINLNSGERIDGRVNIHFKQGEVKIRSARFGSVTLSTEELAGLSKPGAGSAVAGDVSPEQADDQLLASIQGKGSENSSSPSNAGTSKKIGAEQEEEQEEEQVQQVFLRASGVLLEPGDQQYEISGNYVLERGSGLLAENRVRTFLFPLIARVGLLPGLESFLTVPFQYQERSTITNLQSNAFADSSLFSIGDVLLGLKYAFHREDDFPEIIGTFDFRAPTGPVRNPILPTSIIAGSGQWAVAGGLNLIKSFDPVILFGGLRYQYNIFDQHNDVKFGSYSNFGYNLGLGFAVNNRVTLIGQFQGNYLSQRSFSGRNIAGTGLDGVTIPERELATLRGGFTYKLASKQYIEPSVTFGLTDVSPDVIIGLSYNRRL